MSDKISQKSKLDIKVHSLNFRQYPEFTGELLIENEYKLNIHGILSFSTLDLDFSVTSDCISSNLCRIEDDVDIKGKLYGEFKDFTFKGEGKILDGTIAFDGAKKRRTVEDINLVLSNFSSAKLFAALDEKPMINGISNAHVHFDTFGKQNTKGEVTLHVQDNNYSGHDIKVTLDSKVNIQNKKYTFDMNMTMPTATAQIREGQYDQELKYATAKYTGY